MEIDEVTKSWIRNKSDEMAVKAGCRFDLERAEHAVWFFENVLSLYEGDFAGQPFILLPFAKDFVMRLFGWVRWSEKWKRWVRRFKQAFLWVPKKNGKSPLLAGILLYLLTSDGENGQKVYTAARDGKQALIAHRHSEKMTKKSPLLNQYLRVNKTTHTIEFEKTDSYLFLICGDNVNSQEGLNGSCGVDEMHVVDSELWSTLEYMTVSRSEPLIVACSTVGKNLQSIGKEKFDYGEKVEAGKENDISFLHVCYQLKPHVRDEDLKIPHGAHKKQINKALSYWKDANPGWGVTIDSAEMVDAIQRAQKSTFAWSRLKMYRGNQWQSGDTPWLKEEDWDACRRDWTEAELAGASCYGGIDMSLIWDFAAVSYVFPWGRTDDTRRLRRYRSITDLFITEAGFEAIAEHVKSMHDWKARGWITVTAGSATDEETILEKIQERQRQFDLRGMAFDQKFANSIAQRLQDVHGILMQNFNQNGIAFLAPVEYFEQAVIGHTFEHAGNPAVDWMAMNTRVIEKHGGKLLDKPKKGNWNKIDAMPANVMATAMCMANPGVERNFYETHSLEVI